MKHIADHRSASTGERARHFLRLANDGHGLMTLRRLWQRHTSQPNTSRRLVEFLRIARGRRA